MYHTSPTTMNKNYNERWNMHDAKNGSPPAAAAAAAADATARSTVETIGEIAEESSHTPRS